MSNDTNNFFEFADNDVEMPNSREAFSFLKAAVPEKEKQHSALSKTALLRAATGQADAGNISPAHVQDSDGVGKVIERRLVRGKWTPEVAAKFLEYYRKIGHIGKAAALVNLSPMTIHRHRRIDPEFNDLVKEAHDLFVSEVLEEAAMEIGIKGIMQPMLDKHGNIVAHKREIQPRITEMLLKRHDPAYRDKQDATNVAVGVTVVAAPLPPKDDYKAQIAERNKQIADRKRAEDTDDIIDVEEVK